MRWLTHIYLSKEEHNIYLSKEGIENIKTSVITNVMKILPYILEEIIPLIVGKSQILINANLEKVVENYRQTTRKSNNTNDDVNDFLSRNKGKWREELQKRKDCYYKFVRCDQLIPLYNECLEEESIYIPRKFRNGDIYTMNQNEKNIYFKLDLMKLKAEMEVLTTRREHFRNKLDDIDKEMTDFINNKTTSELIAEKIKEKWVKDSVTNNGRIEKVWQNNINGNKEAFQKDKMKMRNLTEDSTTPEDIAQTERNANIR